MSGAAVLLRMRGRVAPIPFGYRGNVYEVVGDSSRDGEWAVVRLRVGDDRIVAADAPGLERPLVGLTLLEAARVQGETLPVDALANAIGPIFRAEPTAGRVAVAMSGGVDSAVALLKAGRDAIGVTLRLWLDPDGPSAERACCSPEAVLAARATCHSLGLPHVTVDLREGFRRAVVESFVRGYARGETPNPCITCNGRFRFAELLAFAERAGAKRLATGHYARLVGHRGRTLLARAADVAKDQSYMLAALAPARLGGIWFPLGDQTKEETRAEAARAGLGVAGRRESQEACFLAGDDYRSFLGRRGLQSEAGPVIDEDGRQIGVHDGFWRYTAGQRRGLRLSASKPQYVVRTDPQLNVVVVGPQSSLARSEVTARGNLYVPAERVEVKLRHRSPAVPARIERIPHGFRVLLEQPAFGVAPGQAAVLYEQDAVVGAGVIVSSARVADRRSTRRRAHVNRL